MGLSWPVKGPVSQSFGSNPNSIQPNGHTGVDFAIPVGTPIYAPENGIIDFEGWASTLSASNIWWIAPAYAGICVLVNHQNGLISLHGHMSSTVVSKGQRVTKGQIIGYSGSTGLSTGPHLHYEILGWPLQPYNGFYGRVNPNAYISGYAQDAGAVVAPTPPPMKANQRLVGPNNLNQRSEAKTSASVVRTVKANTVETFTGYVRGENVSIPPVTSNIWYKDAQGYVWSGGFTTQTTAGLTDLTPAPPLEPNERKVNAGNVNHRDKPNTGAAVVRVISANTREKFDGYVKGETVTVNGFTSDVWYKDATGYAWAGGFTPSNTSGLTDLTPKAPPVVSPLKPNQRLAGPTGAIQRDKAARAGAPVRTIAGGTVETFTGYVRGESVTIDGFTSDIWYKDAQGYVWSGGFMTQGTAGLTDQTPAPVEPAPVPTVVTRKSVPEGVRLRSLPGLNGVVKATLPGNVDIAVKGYVEGDVVLESNLWYVLEAGYSHSSGWTTASTEGLKKLEIVENPAEVEAGSYSFVPDFDFVEYLPANINNRQDGNFPLNPSKLVLHQFDAKEKNPSLAGVISYFQTARANPTSAHFGVSGKRIVQFVSLRDRAFHASTVGNDYIGIEIDPQEDADTVASVKKLITALNEKYGKTFQYTHHSAVPGNDTLCGADIHLELYKVATPAPPAVIPPVTPPVEPPVTPPVEPPVDPPKDEEVIIPPVVNPDDGAVTEPSFEVLVDEILGDAGSKLKELWRNSQ